MRNGITRRRTWLATLLVALLVAFSLGGCGSANDQATGPDEGVVATKTSDDLDEAELAEGEADDDSSRAAPRSSAGNLNLSEDGTYTSKDEVAWYLHTYGHLPDNFVTKKEAEAAGWKTKGLSIDEACPGKSIGGNHFGNYEGILPDARGRKWYECDIDYRGGRSRGAKRLVYSNDGLIYYTEDHYSSFERLY